MPYKRKKYHNGDTHLKRRWRVRNRKKDLDEIDEDLKEGKHGYFKLSHGLEVSFHTNNFFYYDL